MPRSNHVRKQYRPRLTKIPMIGEGELHRMIAIHLHSHLDALRRAPSVESFDTVGQILNMVGVTIEHDARFAAEARLIAGGAAAMNQIAAKVTGVGEGKELSLREHELAPIEIAASAVDGIVGRLDISRLHAANVRIKAGAVAFGDRA